MRKQPGGLLGRDQNWLELTEQEKDDVKNKVCKAFNVSFVDAEFVDRRL